jgi:hypothetical protein
MENENTAIFSKSELKTISDALIFAISNCDKALTLINDENAQKAINAEREKYQILNTKVCALERSAGTLKAERYKIKSVEAVYTGGGVYLFYGALTNGAYFLTDDYGCTQILNESPEDFDESLYEEWQNAHLIEELTGARRERFVLNMLNTLERSKPANISELQIKAYKKYMIEQ